MTLHRSTRTVVARPAQSAWRTPPRGGHVGAQTQVTRLDRSPGALDHDGDSDAGAPRTSGQRTNEMDVVWFFREQHRMDRFGETAPLSEVEAERGSSGDRGDVDGSRSGSACEVGCGVPQPSRCTLPPVRSAHVEKGQPAEPRFERRVDDRHPHERITIKRAEEDRTVGDEICAVLHLGGHAVLAGSFAIPRRDLGQGHGSLLEPTVDHRVLDIDVLRPIHLSDERDVVRCECSYRQHTPVSRARHRDDRACCRFAASGSDRRRALCAHRSHAPQHR